MINYLWLSPAELHRGQQGEIDRLHGVLSGAAAELSLARSEVAQAKAGPSLTPHELEQHQLAASKMASFAPEEARVIRALLQHGEVQRKDVGNLGFSTDLFYAAIDKGKKTALVTEREDNQPGGVHEHLSINPVFESALKHYFAQPLPR